MITEIMKSNGSFKILSICFVLMISLLLSCDNFSSTSKEKKRDGLVKQYRKDGSLKTEITYANGKKNGVARMFYKNKKIRQEVPYTNDLKHGIVTTYYENGKKFEETPYDSGVIHGIRKKYRQNGKLYAEIPFRFGQEGKGLKEYLLNGSIKKNYPKIVFNEKNRILKDGTFKLIISMSSGTKSVEFYKGKLKDGKYLGDDVVKIFPQNKGRAELAFFVPPGDFRMQEINVIAKVKTTLGNPFIIERKYNLAIENTGY